MAIAWRGLDRNFFALRAAFGRSPQRFDHAGEGTYNQLSVGYLKDRRQGDSLEFDRQNQRINE